MCTIRGILTHEYYQWDTHTCVLSVGYSHMSTIFGILKNDYYLWDTHTCVLSVDTHTCVLSVGYSHRCCSCPSVPLQCPLDDSATTVGSFTTLDHALDQLTTTPSQKITIRLAKQERNPNYFAVFITYKTPFTPLRNIYVKGGPMPVSFLYNFFQSILICIQGHTLNNKH